MRVIARKPLLQFSSAHPDAKAGLDAWFHEARAAAWKSSTDIKARYRSASIINKRRVVFNICGNKFRLVVEINYAVRIVYIRFIGTHEEYERIDVENI
jgi:mRNA interferase HigB